MKCNHIVMGTTERGLITLFEGTLKQCQNYASSSKLVCQIWDIGVVLKKLNEVK